jgi:DNA repair protein RadA/Sms
VKPRTEFVCAACGHASPKWAGKCAECGAVGSLQEREIQTAQRGLGSPAPFQTRPLKDIPVKHTERLRTGNPEFDRTLGGGMAPGSLVLIGGDPGVGKSTLVLQTLATLAAAGVRALYVSGEESAVQVKLRSERLGASGSEMLLLCETSLPRILDEARKARPQVMVIDSVQTIYRDDIGATPGSVSQLRECTLDLMVFAKTTGCVTLLIGHVTKEGQIAGPRVLEHMVDTVCYFEGDRKGQFRILRTIKNRFGATDEIGVFEMSGAGLLPVGNPSKVFLQENTTNFPGSVVSCTMEGSRAMLFEIQSLVGSTSYALPQRVAQGIDQKRLTILLALLERFGGLSVGTSDVFVSVAGGLRIDDPGTDLALALAVAGGLLGFALPARTLVMGELGLSGEVRSVSGMEQRVKEAERLGFETLVLPASGKLPKTHAKTTLVRVARLEAALEWAR